MVVGEKEEEDLDVLSFVLSSVEHNHLDPSLAIFSPLVMTELSF